MQREHRSRLFALAAEMGLGLAAMGTHPWANYLDQRIIDTVHYKRLRDQLRWVAQRNNTWSLHVHMGVQGADRAIAVCDHLRGVLPQLLAASANSPFLDGQDTGLASVRTQIFTRTFPRCVSACIAQAAIDHSEGALPAPLSGREIEENLWRAIRYGMDGAMIDFERGEEIPTAATVEGLMEWTAPAREALAIEADVPQPNGAQRARAAFEEGASLADVYRETVEETRRTYTPQAAPAPAE
jgi:gamma-glutamyl:cysteine ligase YbdK (ATP-grasp superfamily)